MAPLFANCGLTRNRPPKWGVVRPRKRGLVRAGYAQASDPSSRIPWVHAEVSVRIRRPWRDAMPRARWLARARSRIWLDQATQAERARASRSRTADHSALAGGSSTRISSHPDASSARRLEYRSLA